MKFDVRVALAAVALLLSACQGGGFDSGGMGGVGPPVSTQGGQMGAPGQMGGGMGLPGQQGFETPGNEMGAPTAGPFGGATLTAPGHTLAPNQGQYPVANGPTGMKCPEVL